MTETITLGKGISLANQHGYSKGHGNDGYVSPWKRRNIDLKFRGSSKGNPLIVWGINSNHIKKRIRVSLLADVADWYVLGSLVGDSAYDSKIVAEFASLKREGAPQFKAQLMRAELTESLYILLRNYFFYACAREARYHDGVGKDAGRNIASATKSWKNIYKHFGADVASLWLKEVFDPDLNWWSNSYGGYRWMEIAKILHWGVVGCLTEPDGTRTDTPFTKENFIDTAVSLQHNSGCALNKIKWGVHLGDFNMMCNDQHVGIEYLVKWCSPDVVELYKTLEKQA